MNRLKYLTYISIISACIFVGALALNIYNYLNNIEKEYLHYIFWIGLFIFMLSNTWINSIKIKNRK